MQTPEFEVTRTGGTQPEVKALLVNEAFVHSYDFWLPGHQVNITLKKLEIPSCYYFSVHPFQKLKIFRSQGRI